MKKLLLLLGFLLVIVILTFWTPARHFLSAEGFSQLKSWIQSLGWLAPVVFGLLYITATVLALPGSALTIGGGVLFGTLWGTAINLTAATVGAVLAFWLARYLGRDFVAKIVKGRLAQLDQKIERHGFMTVLYLRLIPLFPFNILNYSLGLTRLPLKDYFQATLLGMLPGCFVYTSLGGAGHHIGTTGKINWTHYQVWGPFLLIILLSLWIRFVKKRKER